MTDETKTRAFIIAGGKSRRFGEDKTLYLYEGTPLIERVHNALSPVFDNIAIISPDTEKFNFLNIPVYPDAVENFGAIAGVYTALLNSGGERAFVFPADTPNLSSEFISYMLALPDFYDVIVPFFDGHYQPLHAIYSHTCLPHIEKLIENEKKHLIAFYDDVEVRAVGEDEISYYDDPLSIFRNINFQEDLM